MERRVKLQTLRETRWASRANSLYTFRTAFPVVVQALESLAEDGDAKAKGYLSSILQFDFIIALCATEHVLSNTVAQSTMLQGQSINLIEAAKDSKAESSVYLGRRETTKRFRVNCLRVQRILQQVVKSSPACQGYLRSSVTEPTYLPLHHSSIGTEPSTCPLLVILFKSSMTGCSTTMTGSWPGQYLVPTQLESLNRETTNKIYNAYSNELSHRVAFDNEIVRWKVRWALAEGEK